ncbi:MFS transporter [Caenispirillum salinarum]|uniref:MFS transporter n=1 Tax=Caenispirillum salinarum TaxID=859058 RepID=UPI0038506589
MVVSSQPSSAARTEARADDDPLVPERGPLAWAIRGSLLLAASLTVMAGAVISPSLPELQAHFADVDSAGLWTRLVLTMPALFIAGFAPVAGWVIDRFGRKSMIVAGAVLYGLSGASGLVVDSLWAILVGRAALGLSVAMVMTTAQTLVGDYFQGSRRERFLGIQSAFMAFGGVAFLLAGGFLADLHWRGPFAVYLAALLLAPVMAFVLPEPPRHDPAAVAGRGADADAPPAPARMPVAFVAGLYATAFFTMTTFFMVPTQLPFYLAELGVDSPSRTGMAIACFNLSAGLASMSYGRLRQWLRPPALFAIGFACMAAGYGLIATAGSYGVVMVALALAGPSMGINMPNASVWLLARVPPAMRGRALGGLTTSLFLGQFVSPLASQPVVAAFGPGTAFTVVAALAAAAAATFLGAALWTRSARAPT